MVQQKTPHRILLFDDEEIFSQVVRLSMERIGIDTIAVPHAEDPAPFIREANPFLILMDLKIPPYGGKTAINQIKSKPEFQHIPIYIFSAHEELEKHVQATGADGFFQKPFDVSELQEFIRKRLP